MCTSMYIYIGQEMVTSSGSNVCLNIVRPKVTETHCNASGTVEITEENGSQYKCTLETETGATNRNC